MHSENDINNKMLICDIKNGFMVICLRVDNKNNKSIRNSAPKENNDKLTNYQHLMNMTWELSETAELTFIVTSLSTMQEQPLTTIISYGIMPFHSFYHSFVFFFLFNFYIMMINQKWISVCIRELSVKEVEKAPKK